MEHTRTADRIEAHDMHSCENVDGAAVHGRDGEQVGSVHHPMLGNGKKTSLYTRPVLCAFALADCHLSPAENRADRVGNAADPRADPLEKQAQMLADRAEQVRLTGEKRGDAIAAADRDIGGTMSEGRRDTVVVNNVAAVR